MLEQLSRRLEDAQARLRAALVAGTDTAPFRTGITQIEFDFQRELQRDQQAKTEHEQQRATAVSLRTDKLAAELHQRIAASIPPLPEHP